MDPLLDNADGEARARAPTPTWGISLIFTRAVRLNRRPEDESQSELRIVRDLETTGSGGSTRADQSYDSTRNRTPEQENRALVAENLANETSQLVEDGEIDIQPDALCSRRGIIAITIFGLIFSCILAMFFMYCQGWWALLLHGRDPCDVPLAAWLLFYLIFLPADFFCAHRIRPWAYRVMCAWQSSFPGDEPPWRVRGLQFLYFFLIVEVYSIGLTMLASSKTCAQTAPELYKWVQHWLSFGLLLWFLFYTFAACGLLILQSMIAGGLWKTHHGAHPDTVNMMETIRFDPLSWDGEDGRPSKECCICMENYTQQHDIKRTPCNHVFHSECIKNWLKTQRSCPLCRIDLQDALIKHQITA